MKSFPAPETTTTLQSGSPAIALKQSTISLQTEEENRCEDDVPGTSDRPVNVSVTGFVPPEGFVHGVAFLRTVQLHMCDELCRLTDGQRSVRRSRTA